MNKFDKKLDMRHSREGCPGAALWCKFSLLSRLGSHTVPKPCRKTWCQDWHQHAEKRHEMLGAQPRGKVKFSVSSSSLIPSLAVRSVGASMKLDPGWQRKGGLCYSCSYCTGEEVGSWSQPLGWAWNSAAQHLPRICKVQDAITCITTEKITPSDVYSRYDQCRVVS